MNSYLNIGKGPTAALRPLNSPVAIKVTEQVSGLTLIGKLSDKMRALLVLFFVWAWGHCLPTSTDIQRQETVEPAASIQEDNFVHLLHKATTAAPKTNLWEDLREHGDEIPVHNTHFRRRAVNADSASKKVTVKVPCRKTPNNPCLGSEIYEFILLKAEGLVT